MSNQSQHTPGPWLKRFNDVVSAEGVFVASTYARPAPEQEANAALIAAAPEMLGALVMASESIDANLWPSTLLHIQKVIAKALPGNVNHETPPPPEKPKAKSEYIYPGVPSRLSSGDPG